MKPISKVYTAIIMLFLFAPILILLVFSFNEAKSLSVMSGFSLGWYRELFKDSETLGAVRNTLILALSAAAISTVMGTAAAVGIVLIALAFCTRTILRVVGHITVAGQVQRAAVDIDTGAIVVVSIEDPIARHRTAGDVQRSVLKEDTAAGTATVGRNDTA